MKKKMIFMIALGLLSCNQYMGAFFKKPIENMHKMRQDLMDKVAKAGLEELRKDAYKRAKEVFSSGSMQLRTFGDEIERVTTKKELIEIMKRIDQELEKRRYTGRHELSARDFVKHEREIGRRFSASIAGRTIRLDRIDIEDLRKLAYKMAENFFGSGSMQSRSIGDEIEKATTKKELKEIMQRLDRSQGRITFFLLDH